MTYSMKSENKLDGTSNFKAWKTRIDLILAKKVQCFNCRKYGHYKNHCPKLKKRKEKHKASIAEENEPTKKTNQDGRDFFF
jgi:hypothetical protein